MSQPRLPTARAADVLLLLEGTFPYVSGGVSSWVDQIIRAFPELSFAIIFLGSRAQDYGEAKYPLPDNVVHLERHFLYDTVPSVARPGPREGNRAPLAISERMHEGMRAGGNYPDALTGFRELVPMMCPGGALPADDFLYGEAAWNSICARYLKYCTDPSFVDYFWTIRIMHVPLWQLARIADQAPTARLFHSVSTGYAGLLGAMLKERRRRPLLLSEHGIYTKERKIDLFKSEWIRDNRNVFQRDSTELSYFRQLWIRFFEHAGRICYDAADPIVALFETNRLRQVADGASSERTVCIPNGIRLSRFAPLRALRDSSMPPVLCLIGRVVPIKDVKTFIRAMRGVINRMPEAEAWIAGPADEDATYAEECRNLIASLGLTEKVKLIGHQRMEDLLPKISLVVLSSISEALPLVVLEGFAAGVPAVTTDVGACRQLVEGHGEEDCALGPAGKVVGIADPQTLGDACVDLLADPGTWEKASRAGIARVERFYTDERMFAAYRTIYEQALSAGDA